MPNESSFEAPAPSNPSHASSLATAVPSIATAVPSIATAATVDFTTASDARLVLTRPTRPCATKKRAYAAIDTVAKQVAMDTIANASTSSDPAQKRRKIGCAQEVPVAAQHSPLNAGQIAVKRAVACSGEPVKRKSLAGAFSMFCFYVRKDRFFFRSFPSPLLRSLSFDHQGLSNLHPFMDSSLTPSVQSSRRTLYFCLPAPQHHDADTHPLRTFRRRFVVI
jgi:hypothetical protein